MTDHPITPPPELVEKWVQATESSDCIGAFPTNFEKRICTAAARWGADMELEACCADLLEIAAGIFEDRVEDWPEFVALLRDGRRPKPPSLKEQALAALHAVATGANDTREQHQDLDTIRQALEQLDD